MKEVILNARKWRQRIQECAFPKSLISESGFKSQPGARPVLVLLETAVGVLRTVLPQVCNPSGLGKGCYGGGAPPLPLGREEDGTGRPHDARCIPWCLPKSLV